MGGWTPPSPLCMASFMNGPLFHLSHQIFKLIPPECVGPFLYCRHTLFCAVHIFANFTEIKSAKIYTAQIFIQYSYITTIIQNP